MGGTFGKGQREDRVKVPKMRVVAATGITS